MDDPQTKGLMEFASTSRTMEHAGSVPIAGISMRLLIPISIREKDVVLKVKERVEAQRAKGEVLQLMR